MVDDLESPLGFRWYRFDPEKGFFLNGKHLKLRGVNRHDDYPGLGWALPKSRHIEDIKLIKSMGANFIRTAHYPQHPIVLDTCDKLGLLVWEEVPFDGDGLGKGLALGAEDFARNLKHDLRDTIARDRNHPSIILWSLGNENLYGPTAAARTAVLDLTRKLHAIAIKKTPRGRQPWPSTRLGRSWRTRSVSPRRSTSWDTTSTPVGIPATAPLSRICCRFSTVFDVATRTSR